MIRCNETREERTLCDTEIPVQKTLFGLTPLQQYVLVKCLHEGHTEQTVAGWLGKSRSTIKTILRQARAKISRQGLPTPRAYGRGRRVELQAALPGVPV